MLRVGWDSIRLFLDVLAATIWAGGQITLAALVPVLRRAGADIPRAAAAASTRSPGLSSGCWWSTASL